MSRETALIETLRACAQDAGVRTDSPNQSSKVLPPPASPALIAEAESAMGLTLHPLHRRLLVEIGNGGFGPGYGLLGVKGGHADGDGRTMAELRRALPGSSGTSLFSLGLPRGVVPLCEWGCATWSCLDTRSVDGAVLMLEERGMFDMGTSFEQWLTDWVRGVKLWDTMFEFLTEERINPFTRKPQLFKRAGAPRGVVFRSTTN